MVTFSDTLRELSDSALVSLLAARPDLATPAPASLTSLTARATNRSSLEHAMTGVDQFGLQVLEAIVALTPVTDELTAERLTSAIGAPRKNIDAILKHLAGLALIWLDEDEDGGWRPAPGLSEVLGPYPAGLGPVADPSSSPRTAALDKAPAGARQILDALTWGPPVGRTPSSDSGRTVTEWLVDNSFLTRGDGAHVILPRQVGLELRNGRTHAASAHTPPSPDTVELSFEQIDAQALLAVENIVFLISELLAHWSAQPPNLLRTGGLGVRDLRRMANRLGVDEPDAAFTIELASAAGLIHDDGDLVPRMVPSPAAQEWIEEALPERWARLAPAWRDSNRTPWLIGSRDARGALLNPLSPDLVRPWVARLRTSVLTVLGDHPGQVLSAQDVLDVLTWQTPRSVPPLNAISELLTEAERLGVLGAGALSTMGRTLAAGEDPTDALSTVLPPAVDEVLLQGDLTGIVPGRPTTSLANLIDAVATIESRGGALTVRFTQRSITAALDAGHDSETLLRRLAEHSRSGIPQPLEYLIHDTARRHGRLRVGAAMSYVRVEDPALLTGLVAESGLRHLGLRSLAPTVLVSQVPGPELLEALRAFGLAPVAEGPDGALLHPEAAHRRSPAATRRSLDRSAPVLVESDEARSTRLRGLVAKLRARDLAPEEEPRSEVPEGAGTRPGVAGIPVQGTSDPADALTRLREAIDAKSEVWLEVIDQAGQPERRRVRPITLDGGRLRALDLTREAELTVAVHRIARVATSDPSH